MLHINRRENLQAFQYKLIVKKINTFEIRLKNRDKKFSL